MWSLWACETMTASRSLGSKVHSAVRALRVDPVGVVQAAVEQDPAIADLEEVGAAGHLPGGPVERDAQPIFLRP